MAFAQLTHRESLRDIESCLRAVSGKPYHLGIRGEVSRSTLADANERRDWRVYADLAKVLIAMARPLYAHDPLIAELDSTVYALESTTIDVCLSLCPWAPYERSRGAVKMHTLLDLRGSIPTFIDITHGRSHDVLALDRIAFEPGAFYVMDRGYLSFEQTVLLTGVKTRHHYPVALRRVSYRDLISSKRFVFLSNHFRLPALTIAQLYQNRWSIEVFFKWIKQHLRIKSFLGNSPNAVKTQIWIAVSVYVLVAIAQKTLGVDASLYTFLQVVGLTAFEKVPILQVFERSNPSNSRMEADLGSNQLNLFEF